MAKDGQLRGCIADPVVRLLHRLRAHEVCGGGGQGLKVYVRDLPHLAQSYIGAIGDDAGQHGVPIEGRLRIPLQDVREWIEAPTV